MQKQFNDILTNELSKYSLEEFIKLKYWKLYLSSLLLKPTLPPHGNTTGFSLQEVKWWQDFSLENNITDVWHSNLSSVYAFENAEEKAP